MLEIKEIHDQKTWDDFVFRFPQKTFLHSWQWGAFNEATGERIFRLGLYDYEELRGVALIIKVVAKRGTFLFCPHGPLIDWGDKAQFPILVEYLKNFAKKEKAHFIRISPLVQKNDYTKSSPRHQFGTMEFRAAPIHMHAETTWTLDLLPTEDQLLAAMRKTTRNLIRRAEKEGVEVRFANYNSFLDQFYTIHEETVQRQHFIPFSRKYIFEEVRAFAKDDQVLVGLAYHRGEPIAGAIVPIFDGVGYYHHGASLQSKVPAAYALQWEIIRELKKRGCKQYNFWGIAPTDDPKHPWHGLSQFKMGFGGYRTDYLHAQDLPLSWRYWLNYSIESIRRWRRGF